jgi:hypothetical protein
MEFMNLAQSLNARSCVDSASLILGINCAVRRQHGLRFARLEVSDRSAHKT